jgi:predicted nucleotidyltransferase
MLMSDGLENHIYPDPQRPHQLMAEIRDYIAKRPFVKYIFVFGSLARNQADRWSDVDMIVVTQKRAQFKVVFDHIEQHKPTLHHSPFVPLADPYGGYILGNVFANESVFHCLDLNFLTLAEYGSRTALERFGLVQMLHHNPAELESGAEADYDILVAYQSADEKRISDAQHFTKKAAKKLLRKIGARDDLLHWSNQLKTVMGDYPDGLMTPNGNIGWLAEQYIAIADLLLQTK